MIVGSKVTLENVKTGVVSTTQSNDSGNFDFIAVQIGTYRLKAEATGFKTGVASDFTVAVSAARVHKDFPLWSEVRKLEFRTEFST